jgi:hypothetical protein
MVVLQGFDSLGVHCHALSVAYNIMAHVFTFKYESPMCGFDYIQVYETLQGCIDKLAMMKEHNNLDEDDKVTIELMEVTSDALAEERLTSVRKYKKEREAKAAQESTNN